MIPYTINQDSVNMVLKGAPKTMWKTDPRFKRLCSLLVEEEWDRASLLMSQEPEKSLPAGMDPRMASRYLAAEKDAPIIRFNEKMKKNPNPKSIDRLFEFLKHNGIPITENGNFLAYKAIRRDWKDIHSGTYDNSIGSSPKMNREDVVYDPARHCESGFHVGALEYASAFKPADGRIVICEVDPANVVSVPNDHNGQKLRCCQYKVVALHTSQMESTIASGLAARPATHVPTPTKEDVVVKSKVRREFRKIHAKTREQLWECSIAELRTYAARGLFLYGASKLRGGKSVLIEAILEARG